MVRFRDSEIVRPTTSRTVLDRSDTPFKRLLTSQAISHVATAVASFDQAESPSLSALHDPVTLFPSHAKEVFQAIAYYKSMPGPGDLESWFLLSSATFAGWLSNPDYYAQRAAKDAANIFVAEDDDDAVSVFEDPAELPEVTPTPQPGPGPLPYSPAQPDYVPPYLSAAANFQRSIRRVPSDFTAFKKDSDWSSWNRSLLATATAQAVQLSYNLAYTPTSEGDKEYFKFVQQYNYSVLNLASANSIW